MSSWREIYAAKQTVFFRYHTSKESPCVDKVWFIQLSPVLAVTVSILSEPQLLSIKSITPRRHIAALKDTHSQDGAAPN